MRLFLLLAGMLLLATSHAQPGGPDRPLALVGATVLAGRQLTPIPDAVLVLAHGRIQQVGPRHQVRIPADARRVDLHGKWIQPGLVDAHIHFFQSGSLYTRPDFIDLRSVRPYPAEIARIKGRIPDTLARYLASGVTSVMDVGGPMWTFEVRAQANHLLLAPHVEVSGPLIGTYAPAELAVADPPIIVAKTPGQAQTIAETILPHRPDYLKFWFIHFKGQNTRAQARLLRAVIATAHAHGVRVIVHATELEVARAAVTAGADILAHSIDDAPVDDALIQQMQQHHVVYITTLITFNRYHAVFAGQVHLTAIEQRLGDPRVIASWSDMLRLFSPGERAAYARSVPPTTAVAFQNLKRMTDAGITVAAGTDAGNIGTLHGPSLHREMELMQQAGLAPRQVLIDATLGGAIAMGRQNDLGSIESGKQADLLIVAGDPLQDVRNAQRIFRVVKGGVLLAPETITAHLH